MKHRIGFAIMAGILATAVTACDNNNQGIATGPTASAARPPVAVVSNHPGAAPRADAVIHLADAFPGSLGWYDAEGHRYTVEFAGQNPDVDGLVRHFRDEELFAEVAPINEGGGTSVFIGGQLMQVPEMIADGPSELRAMADSLVTRRDRPGARPFRQMAYPCQEEVNGYLIASAELIAAGAYLQRNPTTKRARTAFLLAVGNFGLAWRALYNCTD